VAAYDSFAIFRPRWVLLAAQVLRQAEWQGDPFLAVTREHPAWMRARWDQAQVVLAQWQRQQAQARWRGELEALVLDREVGPQAEETDDDGSS
jgi:hypothetical protein